jgi:hypothetical protein
MPRIRVTVIVEVDNPLTKDIPVTATWVHTENHGDNPSFWGDAVRKTIHNAGKIVMDAQTPVNRIDTITKYL